WRCFVCSLGLAYSDHDPAVGDGLLDGATWDGRSERPVPQPVNHLNASLRGRRPSSTPTSWPHVVCSAKILFGSIPPLGSSAARDPVELWNGTVNNPRTILALRRFQCSNFD